MVLFEVGGGNGAGLWSAGGGVEQSLLCIDRWRLSCDMRILLDASAGVEDDEVCMYLSTPAIVEVMIARRAATSVLVQLWKHPSGLSGARARCSAKTCQGEAQALYLYYVEHSANDRRSSRSRATIMFILSFVRVNRIPTSFLMSGFFLRVTVINQRIRRADSVRRWCCSTEKRARSS